MEVSARPGVALDGGQERLDVRRVEEDDDHARILFPEHTGDDVISGGVSFTAVERCVLGDTDAPVVGLTHELGRTLSAIRTRRQNDLLTRGGSQFEFLIITILYYHLYYNSP